MCFRSQETSKLCIKYGFNLSFSSPYHPQGNRQANSSNKRLMKIIKSTLAFNTKIWDNKLKFALWVDRVTYKVVIRMSPFEIVYGTNVKWQ